MCGNFSHQNRIFVFIFTSFCLLAMNSCCTASAQTFWIPQTRVRNYVINRNAMLVPALMIHVLDHIKTHWNKILFNAVIACLCNKSCLCNPSPTCHRELMYFLEKWSWKSHAARTSRNIAFCFAVLEAVSWLLLLSCFGLRQTHVYHACGTPFYSSLGGLTTFSVPVC